MPSVYAYLRQVELSFAEYHIPLRPLEPELFALQTARIPECDRLCDDDARYGRRY